MTPITTFSWLVFDTTDGVFTAGHARVDHAAGVLTVSAYGLRETAGLGRAPPNWLAQSLLRALARRAAGL